MHECHEVKYAWNGAPSDPGASLLSRFLDQVGWLDGDAARAGAIRCHSSIQCVHRKHATVHKISPIGVFSTCLNIVSDSPILY